MRKILNMPIGSNWILRRGQEPVFGKNFDLDQMITEIELKTECEAEQLVC